MLTFYLEGENGNTYHYRSDDGAYMPADMDLIVILDITKSVYDFEDDYRECSYVENYYDAVSGTELEYGDGVCYVASEGVYGLEGSISDGIRNLISEVAKG